MLVDKVEWITMDNGKEALVIPKELIADINEHFQGVKHIITKPDWKEK